jgi:hypothetical protein
MGIVLVTLQILAIGEISKELLARAL